MVYYECNICNFATNLKGNYKQHLNCKKHFTNTNNSLMFMVKTQKDPKKTQKDPKKTQKDPIFECDYCSSLFSTYAHKRRHERFRCKKNGNNNQIIKEKNKLCYIIIYYGIICV